MRHKINELLQELEMENEKLKTDLGSLRKIVDESDPTKTRQTLLDRFNLLREEPQRQLEESIQSRSLLTFEERKRMIRQMEDELEAKEKGWRSQRDEWRAKIDGLQDEITRLTYDKLNGKKLSPEEESNASKRSRDKLLKALRELTVEVRELKNELRDAREERGKENEQRNAMAEEEEKKENEENEENEEGAMRQEEEEERTEAGELGERERREEKEKRGPGKGEEFQRRTEREREEEQKAESEEKDEGEADERKEGVREEIEKRRKEWEKMEKEKRSKNVKVKGIEGRGREKGEERVKIWLKQITGREVEVDRIREKGGRTWIVEFKRKADRDEVLEEARKIARDEGVEVTEDKTWEERRMEWRAKEKAGEERRKGRRARVEGDAVVTDEGRWIWVERDQKWEKEEGYGAGRNTGNDENPKYSYPYKDVGHNFIYSEDRF